MTIWAWNDTLPEPKTHALVACQIRTMFGPSETWTDRTYEFKRCDDGLWALDVGYGVLEGRRTWAEAMHWLRSLRPRNVELVEE